MTFWVLVVVLSAALLHATWNAVIKTGRDKFSAMVVMTVTQASIGFVIAMQLPFPAAEVWPWLIASGLFHAFYKFFLIFAYERGDLSRVYPIARGAAPLIVLALSPLVLSDVLSLSELIGVLILAVGIIAMARGTFTSGENIRLLPFALASATMTAGYSIVDGIGARISGDATVYVAWLFALDGVFLLPVALIMRGRGALPGSFGVWRSGVIAAVASYGAYALVVWAMTQAPIALVTALRETSILFAVLIGWLLFSERMDRMKTAAALLIVLGVVATRL